MYKERKTKHAKRQNPKEQTNSKTQKYKNKTKIMRYNQAGVVVFSV